MPKHVFGVACARKVYGTFCHGKYVVTTEGVPTSRTNNIILPIEITEAKSSFIPYFPVGRFLSQRTLLV